VLVINKTAEAIKSTIAFTKLSLPASAEVYTYSAADLASIEHASSAPIKKSSLSYSFPGYSAVMFVIKPTAAAAATAP
jgi:hypothetical protein